MRLLATALLLAGIGAATPAAAAERVAIGSFRLVGDPLSPPSQQRVRASLSGGLAAAGYEVLPDQQVAQLLESSPGLVGCETATCLQRLAEQLGVGRVVKASLEVVGTSNYILTLELFDGLHGRTLARVEDSCTVCTLKEANDAISSAALRLHAQGEAAAGPAPAGGARAQPQQVPPAALAPVPQPRSSKILRWAGIGLGGAGVIGLVSGITLLAVNGRKVGYTIDPAGNDHATWLDNLGGGVALTVLGGAALAGGGVLIWRSQIAHSNVALAPQVGPGAAGAVLAGSF